MVITHIEFALYLRYSEEKKYKKQKRGKVVCTRAISNIFFYLFYFFSHLSPVILKLKKLQAKAPIVGVLSPYRLKLVNTHALTRGIPFHLLSNYPRNSTADYVTSY